MLNRMKDGALGIALKSYLADKFKEYGDVQDVSIDTKHNKLTLKALLRGERDAVTASVDRYEIEREGEDRYIILKSFSSSRQWLTLLLGQLFTGKRYKLPSKVAGLL